MLCVAIRKSFEDIVTVSGANACQCVTIDCFRGGFIDLFSKSFCVGLRSFVSSDDIIVTLVIQA